jgi:hypothetical protein
MSNKQLPIAWMLEEHRFKLSHVDEDIQWWKKGKQTVAVVGNKWEWFADSTVVDSDPFSAKHKAGKGSATLETVLA